MDRTAKEAAHPSRKRTHLLLRRRSESESPWSVAPRGSDDRQTARVPAGLKLMPAPAQMRQPSRRESGLAVWFSWSSPKLHTEECNRDANPNSITFNHLQLNGFASCNHFHCPTEALRSDNFCRS